MSGIPKVIWFVGLSGAGKSQLADLLAQDLKAKSLSSKRIDGDLRRKKSQNRDFSKQGRVKNNLEIIDEVSRLRGFDFVIVSTISPYEEAREKAREKLKNYLEIYVSTSIEVCEKRDPKGLYKLARRGQIKNFTGIDDPFEVPMNCDLSLDTDGISPDHCIEEILKKLKIIRWIK